MKNLFIAFLILTCNSAVFAADTYTIDSRHTFPSFEINHLGFSIQRGRFNNTNGNIVIDKTQRSGGSIEVTIDTDSISTGLDDLEDHLRSEEFFNVDTYPEAKFISSQLFFNQDRLASVDGNLTLHGITRPVHLVVDYFHCGTNPISQKYACGVNATTTIKRSEFGIDKYVPLIANEVKIILQVEAIKNEAL